MRFSVMGSSVIAQIHLRRLVQVLLLGMDLQVWREKFEHVGHKVGIVAGKRGPRRSQEPLLPCGSVPTAGSEDGPSSDGLACACEGHSGPRRPRRPQGYPSLPQRRLA